MAIPRKFCRGKIRQPTFFTPDKIFRDGLAFGKNRENAWRFSFSDRFFRLTLVKFVFSYEVLKTCVRRVIFSGSFQSSEQSEQSRTYIKGDIFSRLVLRRKFSPLDKSAYIQFILHTGFFQV